MQNYSVLMSVYKKAGVEELKQSIDSMLKQTVAPEQFVLVLDGPVGEALKTTIDEYSQAYPDVFTIVPLAENHGLAFALDEGLKACRNELVARMDGDDYALPDRCEVQLAAFEDDSELALLGGHTQHFKDKPEDALDVYGRQPLGVDAIKSTIRRNSAFSHPTVMFKKSAVIASGMYDQNLRRSQDHDLFTRMIAQGYKCENIDKVLVMYRADDDGMLRNRNKESCRARVIIQKRLLERKQCSLIDYLYIKMMVFGMRILPEKMFKYVYSVLKEGK